MVSPAANQAWVVSPVLLSKLGQGMMLGFTSCLLPALQAPDSPIKLSMGTSSWIVATLGIGTMTAYLFASYLMVIFGRRITFAVIQLPAIVGMLLISSATNVTALICGRFLAGLTAGAMTVGAVAISEYCSPRYRGMFLNMKTAGLYLGSLIVHILGYQLHWKFVAVLCVIPFILAFVITCTWPESPFWLAQKRRFRESKEIFYRLRGTTEDSIREIEDLIRTQKNSRKPVKRTFIEQMVELVKTFTKINFLKPALVFVFAAILLEASGRHAFPAYATLIIIKITGDSTHTFVFNIVFDVLLTVSALFSSYLIRIMKLRKLLFSTGMASCILLALACCYMYLAVKDIIPKDNTAIPISLFGLYFIAVNLGCAPVPLALMGELFPLEHRAVGVSFSGYTLSIILTITLKIMPIMLQTLEVYGAFAVLALCTALSLLALYFTLPETKGRTLQEIEDFFSHGQYKEVSKVSNEDGTERISEEESLR